MLYAPYRGVQHSDKGGKKMKKIISLFLALALSFAIVSCDDADDDGKTPESGDPSSSEGGNQLPWYDKDWD